MNVKTAKKVIHDTTFAVVGILVQDGATMRAIASIDEENPVKMKGQDLYRFGFDVIALLNQDYIYPVTNQDVIEEAIQAIVHGSSAPEAETRKRRGRPPKAKTSGADTEAKNA